MLSNYVIIRAFKTRNLIDGHDRTLLLPFSIEP
jgi:hypothetical protein